MLPDDMPAPGQEHYPTLSNEQWQSELGESQKRQIDHHRASRKIKNPKWMKNTMIQENYLQKDTQPTVPNSRKSIQLAKFARENGLWDRLVGICQGQATYGKCRFWNTCKAWHLNWDPSVDKRRRQLIANHSPQ
jgi:hypothetical protein